MGNNIRIFENNDFGKLEVIEIDGKPYFPASTCARILGYSNPRDAIKRHCKTDGVVKRDGVSFTTNQYGKESEQIVQTNFISEGNLYRLIAHSKLPTAEKFERWVFDEVIPLIRKTGSYNMRESYMIEYPIERAKRWIEEEKERRKLLKENNEMRPKVEFANKIIKSETNILVRDFAKILCNNNMNIGEKRLFNVFRNCGILNNKNIPYQRYIDAGYFVVKETPVNINDKEYIRFTTLVTPKGQMWISNNIDKLLDKLNNIENEIMNDFEI